MREQQSRLREQQGFDDQQLQLRAVLGYQEQQVLREQQAFQEQQEIRQQALREQQIVRQQQMFRQQQLNRPQPGVEISETEVKNQQQIFMMPREVTGLNQSNTRVQEGHTSVIREPPTKVKHLTFSYFEIKRGMYFAVLLPLWGGGGTRSDFK